MNILLLTEKPYLQSNSYYVPLAVPLLNGYFADNKDVSIKHLFVKDDGYIEEDVDLESFDLIGYSCITPEKIFLLWPHVQKFRDRFYVGGPGFHIIKDVLDENQINYFEGFGEWFIEDKLNIPRNPNIFSEQKILFTDRLIRFFEDNKNNENYKLLLLIVKGSVFYNQCLKIGQKPKNNSMALNLGYQLEEQNNDYSAKIKNTAKYYNVAYNE